MKYGELFHFYNAKLSINHQIAKALLSYQTCFCLLALQNNGILFL